MAQARAGKVGIGGECLKALFRGDEDEAYVIAGAVLVAEALYYFRKSNVKE